MEGRGSDFNRAGHGYPVAAQQGSLLPQSVERGTGLLSPLSSRAESDDRLSVNISIPLSMYSMSMSTLRGVPCSVEQRSKSLSKCIKRRVIFHT